MKNIFKCIYSTCATVIGWLVLRDSFLLPPGLGGSGSLHNAFKSFPYVELPRYYNLYFTGAMGYHVGQAVSQFFAKEKTSDYLEMMFHHIITFHLFAFSYMTNTLMGGIVVYLHDIGDIFIAMSRVFGEQMNHKYTFVSFTTMLVVWAHTRLYMLP